MDTIGSVAASLTESTAPCALDRVGRDGGVHLEFARRGPLTVLSRRAYTLPLQVLAPLRLDDPAAVVSMLNPGGGIVGGDRLTVEVAVGSGAHACLTTPSATKVYRTAGPVARQDVRLRVAAGGILEWVPDHTIPFAGSALRQTLDVEVERGGRLILFDTFAAGRVGRGEAWQFALLESSISVREGTRWLVHDRFVLEPPGPWTSLGCSDGDPYFGALVVVGDGDMTSLARAMTAALAREGVKGAAGVGPHGAVVARMLAAHAPAFGAGLEAIWRLARQTLLGLPALALRKP